MYMSSLIFFLKKNSQIRAPWKFDRRPAIFSFLVKLIWKFFKKINLFAIFTSVSEIEIFFRQIDLNFLQFKKCSLTSPSSVVWKNKTNCKKKKISQKIKIKSKIVLQIEKKNFFSPNNVYSRQNKLKCNTLNGHHQS